MTKQIKTNWHDVPKIDPLAEIKAAHKAGKRIQWRGKDTDNEWMEKTGNFDFRPTNCEYRIAPWSLPAPPAGQQWHRTDWTEDMLPEGWRPLLKGEIQHVGDEYRGQVNWFSTGEVGTIIRSPGHYRTRRPLPTPPRMVPLTREDVPNGSVFRSPSGSDFPPVKIGNHRIGVMMTREYVDLSWLQLKDLRWLIHRPGDNYGDGMPRFRKCEKPEETK
jgi:hypothetical protein